MDLLRPSPLFRGFWLLGKNRSLQYLFPFLPKDLNIYIAQHIWLCQYLDVGVNSRSFFCYLILFDTVDP